MLFGDHFYYLHKSCLSNEMVLHLRLISLASFQEILYYKTTSRITINKKRHHPCDSRSVMDNTAIFFKVKETSGAKFNTFLLSRREKAKGECNNTVTGLWFTLSKELRTGDMNTKGWLTYKFLHIHCFQVIEKLERNKVLPRLIKSESCTQNVSFVTLHF